MENSSLIHHHHQKSYALAHFGFWLYIMSDLILFATLFATFAVLHNNTFGGVSLKEILDTNTVFLETILLLTSSTTAGLSMLALQKGYKKECLIFLFISFLLGVSFVILEIHEFKGLIDQGHGFDKSAALSSFFTLVGTHGAHVSLALIWMMVMIIQIIKKGITPNTLKRHTLLTLFWHFLDVVWIFIFSIVYLIGAI